MVYRIIHYLERLVVIVSQKIIEKWGVTHSPSSPPSSTQKVKIIPKQVQLHLAKKYSGKLLLRNEIFLSDKQFAELVNARLFVLVESFHKTFFKVYCTRCNNSDNNLLGVIDCAICKKSHFYCRKCIMMGRITECEPLYKWMGVSYSWPKHKNPCQWLGTLSIAQQHAANKINSAITHKSELAI